MNKYREEMKFLCGQNQLEIIYDRLKVVMDFDKNQKGMAYRIRSLYFDDYYDTAFHENDAGVDDRKKFRIRVYENPNENMNLEIKYKLRGKTLKEACPITKEQYEAIMNNDLVFDPNFEKPLLLYYLENKTRLLKPKVIVEYQRTVFVDIPGNVRITFDRNISYSDKLEDFLNDRVDLVPLLPKNQHLLEVKYDEFLPDYTAQLLEIGSLEQTAFSKYYLSRLSIKGEREYDSRFD